MADDSCHDAPAGCGDPMADSARSRPLSCNVACREAAAQDAVAAAEQRTADAEALAVQVESQRSEVTEQQEAADAR
jgi:hypothetical protein